MSVEDTNVALQRCIERKVKRDMVTRQDFVFLSEAIEQGLGRRISDSTLRRVWGCKKETLTSHVSVASLNILACFLGYNSFDDFATNYKERESEQSEFLSTRRLYAKDMEVGQQVEVSWLPNRKVTFRYDGELQFAVTESLNSKLLVGDRANCLSFVEHEPLFLTHLKRDGLEGEQDYVCGKRDGITFTVG